MFAVREIDDLKVLKILYRTRMKKDFSKNELKPFAMIRVALKRKKYICYGIYDEEAILGYAFFVVFKYGDGKQYYLLDYFAVEESHRGKGIGSEFITKLIYCLSDRAEFILCEVENPEYAINDTERNIRQKRVEFYLKNGFNDTNATALVFGMEYKLLLFSANKGYMKKEIEDSYYVMYKNIIPKLLFDKNVLIHRE